VLAKYCYRTAPALIERQDSQLLGVRTYGLPVPLQAILLCIGLIGSTCAQTLGTTDEPQPSATAKFKVLGLATVQEPSATAKFTAQGLATVQEPQRHPLLNYTLPAENQPTPNPSGIPGATAMAKPIDLNYSNEPGKIRSAFQIQDLPVVPDTFGPESIDSADALQLAKPWWSDLPLEENPNCLKAELEELIWLAISNSPHIQAVLLEPQILDNKASQQLGSFDPSHFVDSIFKDTSDPVGNTLITGGPSRLNQGLWENRAGVRRKNEYGGQAELLQEMFFKDNNSRFFVPPYQANSRLVLNYTQPLLRGRGKAYNRSSFMIATITADQGRFQAAQALQRHAYQISEAYWELYSSRIIMAQIKRGLVNLESLRDRLAGRDQIDVVRSQLYRAEAAIAKQKSAMSAARAQLISSDANLRALIASTELRSSRIPIIPVSPTLANPPHIDVEQVRLSALEHQPHVLEVQQEIKAARAKLQVAQNELQPTLNLVLQSYLAGLHSNNDITASLGDQFTSRPSYNAGLAYQRPKGNIAAQAIARESRMELRKALLKLDDTLLTIGANVEAEVANIDAAYQALESAVQAALATQAEIEFLQAQWNDAFVAPEARNGLQLDQLLNAHIQLISAENSWVQAQRDYMLALARLDLITGTILPTTPFTGDSAGR
jgi:outer membrane protein